MPNFVVLLSKLSYKMASLNRKQREWRTTRDCTAFTSLTLFQFQPRFSLFLCVKKRRRRRCLPLPLPLPKPRRKWCDWHSLKPIDSLKVPPFDTRLLPPLVRGYPSCLLPPWLRHKIVLHCLRGQLHTQKPTHSFLIFPLTSWASFSLSGKLFTAFLLSCETFSLLHFFGRHACGQDRTTPFFSCVFRVVFMHSRLQVSVKWGTITAHHALCLQIRLAYHNHQRACDAALRTSSFIESMRLPLVVKTTLDRQAGTHLTH